MAKNTRKYRYIEMGVRRDSATLASLEKDAAVHHMSEQLGKIAALRLADYYALVERLGTYSLEGLLATPVVGSSPQGATNGTEGLGHASPRAEPSGETVLEHSASLEEKAVEASGYWSTL